MGQRILRISGRALVDMLGPGKSPYEVIEDGLPQDTRIVNAAFSFRYTHDADEAVLKLESDEWPDTPEGQRIEEIIPMMRRTDG